MLIAVWPVLAWFAVQHRGTLAYRTCIVIMVGLPAALPWMAEPERSGLRFLLLLPSLLLMIKTWEIAVNKPREEVFFGAYSSLFFWSVFWPEGHRSSEVSVRKAVRRKWAKTAAFIVLKGLTVFGLLGLNDWVDLHSNWFTSVTWMGFTMYLSLAVVIDTYRLLSHWFGIDQPDFFNAPPLARNPRDFWGRRWNLWFTQTTHRLIFQPLGGEQRPVVAASGVFVFSALMHEYMVMVSLGRFDGRMIVFFLLHGGATILFTIFAKGYGRKLTLPAPVAVPVHFVWFVATAPLFFGPLDDIFTLHEWSWSLLFSVAMGLI